MMIYSITYIEATRPGQPVTRTIAPKGLAPAAYAIKVADGHVSPFDLFGTVSNKTTDRIQSPKEVKYNG